MNARRTHVQVTIPLPLADNNGVPFPQEAILLELHPVETILLTGGTTSGRPTNVPVVELVR